MRLWISYYWVSTHWVKIIVKVNKSKINVLVIWLPHYKNINLNITESFWRLNETEVYYDKNKNKFEGDQTSKYNTN